ERRSYLIKNRKCAAIWQGFSCEGAGDRRPGQASKVACEGPTSTFHSFSTKLVKIGPWTLAGHTAGRGQETPMPDQAVSLSRILAHHARQDPSRPAVIVGDETVTYAELDSRSNRRARFLQAQGVALGDFVTVALPNGLDFYETVFGIWK